MTTSRDIGRELRARRRKPLTPAPQGWDWGPRRPPQVAKAWIVLGLVLVAALVLAAMPPAGAGPAGKGVGQASPKTTTTTTTTTLPPPAPAPVVLEPMTLAPPPAPVEVEAEVAPVLPALVTPLRIDLASGHIPEWAWAGPARLSALGIAAMARAVGCTPAQAVIATAVGLAESGGRTDAVGDVSLMNSTWSYSAGVHQIRGLHREHGTYGTRDPQALLHDMVHNIRAMWEISNGCTNWQPWTMYTNGRWVERAEEAIWGVLQAEGVVR